MFGAQPYRALLRALAIVLGGSYLVQSLILPLRVGGDSMQPTFQSSEFLVTNRLSYRFGTPEFGDVVAIKTNQDNVTILKRVIAVPGDRIMMVEGRLRLNGEWIEEPYAAIAGGWSISELALGANEYWVVGDNRSVSAFGKVHRGNIIGKVL
ncbi:signal peptidase I [bacterium]|nr:signal peptidase I [bacterium]MDA7680175.1 signal peptidase I [bacterium]